MNAYNGHTVQLTWSCPGNQKPSGTWCRGDDKISEPIDDAGE